MRPPSSSPSPLIARLTRSILCLPSHDTHTPAGIVRPPTRYYRKTPTYLSPIGLFVVSSVSTHITTSDCGQPYLHASDPPFHGYTHTTCVREGVPRYRTNEWCYYLSTAPARTLAGVPKDTCFKRSSNAFLWRTLALGSSGYVRMNIANTIITHAPPHSSVSGYRAFPCASVLWGNPCSFHNSGS